MPEVGEKRTENEIGFVWVAKSATGVDAHWFAKTKDGEHQVRIYVKTRVHPYWLIAVYRDQRHGAPNHTNHLDFSQSSDNEDAVWKKAKEWHDKY